MSKKDISKSQIKILWGKSGSRCAICKENIIKSIQDREEYHVGEMAHIEGEKPGSARFNPNMTDEQRANYKNLILLCPTHHSIIDKNESEYTVEKLKQVKREHEKWVEDSLKSHIPGITFAELEMVIKYLIVAPLPIKEKLRFIIPPGEKIEKNKLSTEVRNLITIGMIQIKLVENYLNKHPDILFAERLKAGFVNKYIELRDKGWEGDALFYELLDFASNNSIDFKNRTAGLSVLVYFFERCDVFEK